MNVFSFRADRDSVGGMAGAIVTSPFDVVKACFCMIPDAALTEADSAAVRHVP